MIQVAVTILMAARLLCPCRDTKFSLEVPPGWSLDLDCDSSDRDDRLHGKHPICTIPELKLDGGRGKIYFVANGGDGRVAIVVYKTNP